MSKLPEQSPVVERRDWLAGLLRRGALAGIGLLTACMAGKRWYGACPQVTQSCRTCQLFARCDLPPAQQVRHPRTDKEQS